MSTRHRALEKLESRPYQAKTMVNKLKHVDSWFWIRYTLNPYRGCAHLRVYCDARANQYGLADTFDQVVYYKENAVEVLEKQLPKLKRDIALGGSSEMAFRHLDGREGSFQEHFQVKRRKTKPCFVCGMPIEKIMVGGRGTYFCPKCQAG